MTRTRRPILLSVVVLALALASVLGQAGPALASTVNVLGTNAPPGATFTFTAGPKIPPSFGGLVNTDTYILAPGTYTVVWNPVSDSRGLCTITPSSMTFVATESSNDMVKLMAQYSCPASVPPDTSITGQPADPADTGSAIFSFTGTDNVTAATDLTFECALDSADFTGCTDPQTYTGLVDGSHTFQVRARDEDGNVDPTPASYTWAVQTDTAPPDTTITAQPADPTNQTSATFSFTGTDTVGVAGFQCSLDGTAFSACTSPLTYSSLSQGTHKFQVRAKDAAGNLDPSPATYTWLVDTVAPAISYTLNPPTPEGDNGWYKSNVTVTWSAIETGSGIASGTGCLTVTVSTDQLATQYSCSATDRAGNTGGPVTATVKRDATAPAVSLLGGPVDTASYYYGAVPAPPTCAASDATSGLAAPCSVSGYSSEVGTHTVTATATDNAGNVGSSSSTYTVLAWTLNGFYQPVDMNGVYNVVKNGSTVPLKFEVVAGSELTNTSAVTSLAYTATNCEATASVDEIETTATGGTSLRYDTVAGQFVYNWKTPSTAGKCYRVTMTTQDSSSLVAYFKLK